MNVTLSTEFLILSSLLLRIRGKLGSLLALSINLGILLGFISGHYLSFYTVPKYAIWFSVVCVATAIFFPESPLYLLRKGKLDGAVLALQFYRNSRRLSQQKTVFFKSELDNLLATREEKADYSDDKITWKDFRRFFNKLFLYSIHRYRSIRDVD